MKTSCSDRLLSGKIAGRKSGNSVTVDSVLADQIARLFGMPKGLCFSRGSAGLYALLAALAKRSGAGEVIVPTLCCESVALAAHYAGHSLRFADVSPKSLCVTHESVGRLISERTRAVLVPHLFGIDAQVDAFGALRQIFPECVFVEDLAHAIGGLDNQGRILGCGLDCTLLSFADDKIIPGDGGVMLLGNSPSLPSPRDLEKELVHAERIHRPRLALSLRNLSHAIGDLWREKAEFRPGLFRYAMAAYRDLIVTAGNVGNARCVAAGLKQLRNNRLARYRNYVRYRDGITTSHAFVAALREGSTCWRCPLIFDSAERALRVTDSLRAAGIHASNHFFPLNVLFDGDPCPVGEDIARRIVNLWTAKDTPSSMISRSIKIINQY